MRFTTFHVNAIIGLFIMGGIALGMTWILVQNELETAEFQMVAAILAADVAGIVVVVKHFAGVPHRCNTHCPPECTGGGTD